MNTHCKTNRRGFLLLETTASIAMIVLLIGALAWALSDYSRHSESVRTRMRAVAAAESVLNEIRAGVPENPAAFSDRFKGFSLDVQRSPGEGDWQKLTRVVVKVSEIRDGGGPRPLAELSGYIAEAAR